MKATLQRQEFTNHGTFGRFRVGEFECFSGELPWRDNAPSISCIPVGVYRLIWSMSPRLKKNTYRFLSVPQRAGVLIHSANFMGDASAGLRCQLNGCIALAYKRGLMDGQRALMVSKPAVNDFEQLLAGQPFDLEITNA